jgi:hypothetical protein
MTPYSVNKDGGESYNRPRLIYRAVVPPMMMMIQLTNIVLTPVNIWTV